MTVVVHCTQPTARKAPQNLEAAKQLRKRRQRQHCPAAAEAEILQVTLAELARRQLQKRAKKYIHNCSRYYFQYP